jgi:hypothetical protein
MYDNLVLNKSNNMMAIRHDWGVTDLTTEHVRDLLNISGVSAHDIIYNIADRENCGTDCLNCTLHVWYRDGLISHRTVEMMWPDLINRYSVHALLRAFKMGGDATPLCSVMAVSSNRDFIEYLHKTWLQCPAI